MLKPAEDQRMIEEIDALKRRLADHVARVNYLFGPSPDRTKKFATAINVLDQIKEDLS